MSASGTVQSPPARASVAVPPATAAATSAAPADRPLDAVSVHSGHSAPSHASGRSQRSGASRNSGRRASNGSRGGADPALPRSPASKALEPRAKALRWSTQTTANAPPGRWGHTITRVTSNHALMLGGISGGKIFNDAAVYDISSQRWMTPHVTGTPPTPRWGHSATLIQAAQGSFGRDSLVVLGGREGSKPMPFDELYVLDLTTFEWRKAKVDGPSPRNRYAHSAVLVPNLSQITIFGGHGGRTRYYRDIHMLDTHTFKWSTPQTTGQGPSKRSGHAMTATNSHLVVFGGFNGTAILSDMFVFSLHTYAWNRLNLHGPLPLPGVYGHTMSAVPNSNAVVVFGGCLSAAKLSARTYWVDLQSGTAVQVLVQEPPPSRFWHGECVSSTKLYIFGGSGSKSNALTDVAMLDFFETTPVVPSKISSRSMSGETSPTAGHMAIGMGGMGNLAQARGKKKKSRTKSVASLSSGPSFRSQASTLSMNSAPSLRMPVAMHSAPPPGLGAIGPTITPTAAPGAPAGSGDAVGGTAAGAGSGAGAGSRVLALGSTSLGMLRPVPSPGRLSSAGVHLADAGAGAAGSFAFAPTIGGTPLPTVAAGMPPPAAAMPPAAPQPPGGAELRLQQSVYEHQRQKLALESAIVSALQELNKATIVAPCAHVDNAQAILRSVLQL